MKVKKVMAGAMVGSALVFGAIGAGGGVANAGPAALAPLKPGNPCPPSGCNGPGNGPGNGDNWQRGNGPGNGDNWQRGNGPGNGDNWQRGNGDWDRGAWWANNRHDWWDDRSGPPPWGWGPPPGFQWYGGPPHPFNYWGYDVNPVWDNGFNQWGFWLFGLWIPIFGIGI
jgi:hypothetical protein